MPITLPLRRAGQKRELLATSIEEDVYQSTIKDEQLLKLIETFQILDTIKFHLPIPCRLSQPPRRLGCSVLR